MVEVMKIMVTSFKRFYASNAVLRVPNPAAGQHQPAPPAETPGHPQASPGKSPVDHVLSELFTMTHQSWVVLHSMAH